MPSTQELLNGFEAYTLGDADIDSTHLEFLKLCLETSQASGPAFAQKFQALFEHTGQHFADEESRMQHSGYPAYSEHRADHQRILGDMNRFQQRVQTGRATMAKAWLNESLPTWFDLHAKTMDSSLVAHLKQKK